jgi:hypothetical protein
MEDARVTTAAGTAKPKGRYRPVKRPSPPLTQDQRTRVARRVRALESEYRATLGRQGVTIDIHTDITIGHLADAMVHLEVARAASSRGTPVDDVQMTRWLNLAQRLANQLGLKPSLTDAAPPPRKVPPLSRLIQEGAR